MNRSYEAGGLGDVADSLLNLAVLALIVCAVAVAVTLAIRNRWRIAGRLEGARAWVRSLSRRWRIMLALGALVALPTLLCCVVPLVVVVLSKPVRWAVQLSDELLRLPAGLIIVPLTLVGGALLGIELVRLVCSPKGWRRARRVHTTVWGRRAVIALVAAAIVTCVSAALASREGGATPSGVSPGVSVPGPTVIPVPPIAPKATWPSEQPFDAGRLTMGGAAWTTSEICAKGSSTPLEVSIDGFGGILARAAGGYVYRLEADALLPCELAPGGKPEIRAQDSAAFRPIDGGQYPHLGQINVALIAVVTAPDGTASILAWHKDDLTMYVGLVSLPQLASPSTTG